MTQQLVDFCLEDFDCVLGGAAKIAATLLPDGTIKYLNDWNFITFGEQDGALSERVRALNAAFDKTPIVAAAVSDITQMIWEKLVHLATLAGMASAMQVNVGEILRTQEGGGLMAEFLERNAEIARREGFPSSDSWMAECQKLISNTNSPHTTSMLRDIENKGLIEADHIIGHMLRRAVAHNIDPVLHRMVFAHLQSYEHRRAANRV